MLKPLSPLLQPSDLRTIAPPTQNSAQDLDGPDGISFSQGHSSVVISSQEDDGAQDVVVQAWQVMVSQDEASPSDKCPPSSPNSSTGSHCGFYSFVEDPGSPEALLNEAWMVSPQRQAKLATLKEEKGFKLQSYSSNRKPESLFSENSEDCQYKVDPNNGIQVIGQEEEKELRKDIIRNQAPKKTSNLDLRGSTNQLIEGFSVTYSPISSRPDHLRPPEPGTIDNEQINFNAVRKQFLKIEQLLSPPHSIASCLNSSQQQVEVTKHTVPSEHDEKVTTCQPVESPHRMSVVFDEQDLSQEADSNKPLQENSSAGSSINCETPIEREIRLNQEREENLRHSRGLKHSDGRVEMIEIKIKRLQSPLLKTKDKSRVSFIIQQETQNQNQRKQEHLQQGQCDTQELEDLRTEHDQQDKRTEHGAQCDPGEAPIFPSCYCPHQHSEETGSGAQEVSTLTHHSKTMQSTSWFWKENHECRRQGAQAFIEKEIEEYLRREKELKDLRESREGTQLQLFSPAALVEQATRMAECQFYPPVGTGMELFIQFNHTLRSFLRTKQQHNTSG